LNNVGHTVTGRGIALACKALKRIEGAAFPACVNLKSPEEIAQLLSVHAQPVSVNEIGEYQKENWGLHRQSEEVTKYWLDKHDELVRKTI
jgi:hypothetical protein